MGCDYDWGPGEKESVGVLDVVLDLQRVERRLQAAADSSPSPERASVLRRAAADVAVIAERVRSK